MTKISKTQKISKVNKGTGAGGSKTNENGLGFEKQLSLHTEFEIVKETKFYNIIKFKNNDNNEFIYLHKNQLSKYMQNTGKDSNIIKGHGCKQPDECYLNEKTKTLFIIEKKYQNCGGSVIEKLQTYEFKLNNYKKQYPNYRIVYIYALSEYFKTKALAEIEYLNEKKVPIFWGTDTYKQDIVKFISSN